MTTVLTSRESFLRWLDEQHGFHLAWLDVVEVSPGPSADALPERVRLVLRVQVSRSLRGGDTRRVRELTVVATGLARFDFDPEGFVPGGYVDLGELSDDSPSAASLEFYEPAELRLDAARLEVHSREWDETIPTYFSDRDFSALVPDAPPLEPSHWTALLAEQGLASVWRYYDGPAVDPAQVPADYTGWFLQHPARVAETQRGVFFETVRRANYDKWFSQPPTRALEASGGVPLSSAKSAGVDLSLSLRRDEGEHERALWLACAAYVGTLPGVEVRCGNAVFTGPEWLAHLRR